MLCYDGISVVWGVLIVGLEPLGTVTAAVDCMKAIRFGQNQHVIRLTY